MSCEKNLKTARAYFVSEAQINAEGVHEWPFEPQFPIDVVHHRLSGLRPFRMNRHDYFELVYVKSGELVWQVQDSFLTAKKGDLFVMTSPKYHRFTEKSSPHSSVDSLFFHPDLIQPLLPAGKDSEYLKYFFAQNSSFPHIISGDSEIPREVGKLIYQISALLPARTDRARVCVKTYVKVILVQLLNHINSYEMEPKGFDKRQRAVEQFKPLFESIEKNYGSFVSPTKAAKIVNMSPSNFRRAFKRLTGQSFVPYLTYFRIAKGQELLGTTETPIADIGFEVGFCDQSYFGLVFRRLTHMTPRQYRQQARKEADEKSMALAHTAVYESPSAIGGARMSRT